MRPLEENSKFTCTVWKRRTEIENVIYIPLHLWNPVWKPRKTLFQSVIWANNTAPAKRQANHSDAAPLRLQTISKLSSRILIRNRNDDCSLLFKKIAKKKCNLRRDTLCWNLILARSSRKSGVEKIITHLTKFYLKSDFVGISQMIQKIEILPKLIPIIWRKV